ncbi:hypothetical protein [Marivirga sp.]|uniref:hypothetical protein n=1 Tax=Marivirga sp. TaxID=2018662 RepID=UPI002D7F7146|nr:hypothetical protein [Marivirga sp.]HET8858884.1 hypothetical protein [Marivirga sp.]
MKKALQLFGLLDLIAFAGIFSFLFEAESYPLLWGEIVMVILALSFLISSYLLFTKRKWGIYLNYIQLLPRLMIYSGMSFGFIYLLSDMLNIQLPDFTFVIVATIEVIRLGITIGIHNRYFTRNNAVEVN